MAGESGGRRRHRKEKSQGRRRADNEMGETRRDERWKPTFTDKT